MKTISTAFFLLSILSSAALAQGSAPDPAAGKTLWDRSSCAACHGKNGEGAFGPDLAGRGLSPAQFQHAVRKPWGIMPAFVPSQFSDADLNNFAAYFATLPKPSAPGEWVAKAAADAPHAQKVFHELGCAQCHGPTFDRARLALGGLNMDFTLFKSLVYTHTDAMHAAEEPLGAPDAAPPPANRPAPPLRMGNFNSLRVSEAQLQEIFNWVRDDLGFRPFMQGRLTAPALSASGATYTLNLANIGAKGEGMSAQGLTVALVIPAGATVTATTGDGYKGVRMDADAKGNVAEWQIPRMAPKDSRILTITLSKPGTTADNVKGSIRWTKPGRNKGTDMLAIAPAPLG